MKSSNFKAHLALLFAASMWGLMAPVGKAAMEAGISGLALANMRMIGGAVCFWITSLFIKKEDVQIATFSMWGDNLNPSFQGLEPNEMCSVLMAINDFIASVKQNVETSPIQI